MHLSDVAHLLEFRRRTSPAHPRVVLCHGVYDVLGFAHARHLRAAKSLGDVLVVTVTPDESVGKGPGRPVFSQEERVEMVSALKWVDYAAVNLWPDAVETIRLLRPTCFVKGGEYLGHLTPALEAEKVAVEEVGGRLVFTNTPECHTSDVLRRLCG
jgi:cytidyltransferase-like protein